MHYREADLIGNVNDTVRVLLVMHGAGSGGVETALSTLCKYLDRDRVCMTVVVPQEGPFTEKIRAAGIEVIKAPLEWWTPANWEFGERHYFRFLATLKDRVNGIANIIKERQIDIVHSSTLTVLDGALAARVTGRPHIWNIRGCFDGGPGSSFGIYLSIQTIYDIVDALSCRIVANSHTVKSFLMNYLPAERIEVIQNGVDLSKFESRNGDGAHLERDYPGLRGKRKVALVGRVSTVKGIEDFVRAALKVTQKKGDVGFAVIGAVEDEVLYQKVLGLVARSGVQERIVFTGRRSDIAEILHEIDLLVCSSPSEGLPNSCLEAMAASKAVVATRCGGAEEVVFHGENGYLTPVGDPNGLAETMLKAFKDSEQLKLMGIRGREIVETHYSPRASAGKYEELYLKLYNGKSAVPACGKQWDDVFFLLASGLGAMGQRVVALEREVRQFRNVIDIAKKNFFYRKMRSFLDWW